MAETIFIRAAETVLAGPGQVFGPTDILIEGGRITAIAPALELPPGARIVDGRDRLVTPGLINAHWHSPMQLSPGTADQMNHKVFMWENQVDTANRSRDEIRVSALLGCLQMLKTGTTAVLDHFPEQGFSVDDVGTVVQAYEDCGMRAVVALRIFDGEYSDILPPADRITPDLAEALRTGNPLAPRPLQDSLDLVEDSISRFDHRAGRIRVFPAPSNPVRCSDRLLIACEEIARRHDTGVHCHLLETRTQADLAQQAYGRSMVEHMDALGAISGRWSCAHCNHLSAGDMAIMARHGAVAVLNPESNLKIGSGIPPVPSLLAAGVPCALGTDGTSTNDNLFLQDAMQLAAILHRAGEPDRRRWISAGDVIGMATTGGAMAIREPDLGRIAVGAKADIVLYDLASPALVPLNDPEQQWVFGGPGRVATAIVDGRVVLDDGRALFIDEAAVIAEAKGMLAHIRARNGGVQMIANAVAALT